MVYQRYRPVRKRSRRGRLIASLLAFTLVGYILWAYFLLPAQTVNAISPAMAPYFDTGTASLDWPAYGQAAVGTQTGGLLAKHGASKSTPIASIAKVMTALSVLREKPLKPGESGPTLTLTQADVDIYDSYYLKDGSIAAVKAGEKITEYQALQAVLLPSANNLADTLAIWAFGSLANYTAFANKYAGQLGMSGSHFDDASGFSPQTVSTATDLVKLGQAAMDNAVITEIVGQSSAQIPVAGTIYNVNGMLKLDQGIIGIKTGNTDQAGGCMLLAMKYTFGSTDIVIITAVLGAPHLVEAMVDARTLSRSAKPNFINLKLVTKGQSFGTYQTTWGESSQAVAGQDLSAIVWKGSNVQVAPRTESLETPAEQGATVGTVTASGLALAPNESVPLVLSEPLSAPGLLWRLTHPLRFENS